MLHEPATGSNAEPRGYPRRQTSNRQAAIAQRGEELYRAGARNWSAAMANSVRSSARKNVPGTTRFPSRKEACKLEVACGVAITDTIAYCLQLENSRQRPCGKLPGITPRGFDAVQDNRLHRAELRLPSRHLPSPPPSCADGPAYPLQQHDLALPTGLETPRARVAS